MVVEGFEVWHFLKDFLFPICFDAQVVPFGKINSNHWVECHEFADDTQLYHLPLCSEFFPRPAVMLDRDLQMDKSELPYPQPRENRMLTELLIWESSLGCVPMYRGMSVEAQAESCHHFGRFHFSEKATVRLLGEWFGFSSEQLLLAMTFLNFILTLE